MPVVFAAVAAVLAAAAAAVVVVVGGVVMLVVVIIIVVLLLEGIPYPWPSSVLTLIRPSTRESDHTHTFLGETELLR